MRDTKLEAKARGLVIPEEDLDRIEPVLDALETTFRPLVKTIPFETEPAVMFRCAPSEDGK